MKKLFLSLGLATLMFALGCGSSNNNNGPTPTGNFTLASVNGQYTYQLSGFDLNTGNPYSRAGVFTANGAGSITAGTDDLTEGSLVTSAIVSGTYSISNDGTGFLALTLTSGTVQWAFTLQSSTKMYLMETSATTSGTLTPFTGSGIGELQNSAAFAGPPSGTFVFRDHTYILGGTSITPVSIVGAVSIAGGAVSGGNTDVNTLGPGLASLTLTGGFFNAPDSSGRGSGTLVDSSPSTTTFQYYVVDANNIRILITTPGAVGLGRGEMQTGTFSNASLAGNYAFGSRGDTLNNLVSVHTVGVLSADGNGTITADNFDAMQDGTSTTNANFTGTYTVASNGRALVLLNSGAATQVYWLVNSTRAFFLNSDPNRAEDGSADLQTVSSFSNSTFNGQFAFVNNGVQLAGNPLTISNTIDRVATLQWSGSGGLTLNELINVTGTTTAPGFLLGSYSVSSNGRTTGKINGSTNSINLVFYPVSNSQAYVLQTDADFEVDGMTQLQQ